MPTAEEIAAVVVRGVMAVVVEEIAKDVDVTDDVLGGEAFSFFRSRNAEHALPATKAVELSGVIAAKIRAAASTAVAAVLASDRGATEPAVAGFVHHTLLAQCGEQYGDLLIPEFAVHLSRIYAAMCRRSGLHPQRWCEAFARSIDDGWWSCRR